jgi:hypothetical protein
LKRGFDGRNIKNGKRKLKKRKSRLKIEKRK